MLAQCNSVRDLKPAEIEQIYQAKEILIRNWVEPPSLIELVRQVGLNEELTRAALVLQLDANDAILLMFLNV